MALPEQDPVTCNFIYDVEDYKTTQVLARRLMPISKRVTHIITGLIFSVSTGIIIFDCVKSPSHFDLMTLFPIAVFVWLAVVLIAQIFPRRTFVGTRAFRKSARRNSHNSNRISSEGLNVDTEGTKVSLHWSQANRAVESLEGFAVYCFDDKSGFVWFPKHGFASPSDIDRARSFIQTHVKDFRKVPF